MSAEPLPELEASVAQLCAFVVGTEEYAIDIHRVLEIIQPPTITAVPSAPPFVEGVVNLRGEIVPVVDLRRALAAQGVPERRREKLIVCLVGRRKVALWVDRVTQVVKTARSELKPVPMVSRSAPLSPFVIGAYSKGSRLVLLLNLRGVLTSPEGNQRSRTGG
jgi:purine-binding chemotaxis protein CheW